MVPKFPERVNEKGRTVGDGLGTSFKGAFAYYLHDKRTDEEREQGVEIKTQDRVEWAELRNMPIKDADKAAGWMAYTAMNRDALKAQAGVKTGGRQSEYTVLAYSLGWHPSQNPDKAEMLRAADESIRALGAESHQAAIIAHNDTDHKHVHVIINRVNTQDGRLLGVRQCQKTLQEWALSYERERGKIYCENRARNAEARKTRGDFVRASLDMPGHIRPGKEFTRAVNDNPDRMARTKIEQRRKDAQLAKDGASMCERHGEEWKKLGADHKARKADIHASAKAMKARLEEQSKTDNAPAWAALYRQQEQQRRQFKDREKRITGKIQNALDAVTHSRVSRHTADDKGFLAAAFNFMRSSAAREKALLKAQKSERRDLGAKAKAELGAALRQVREAKTAQLSRANRDFLKARRSLKTRQASEKSDLQAAWKTRNAERKAAYDRAAAEVRQKREAAERVKKAQAKARAEKTGSRAQDKAHTRADNRRAANANARAEAAQNASYAAAKGHREFTGAVTGSKAKAEQTRAEFSGAATDAESRAKREAAKRAAEFLKASRPAKSHKSLDDREQERAERDSRSSGRTEKPQDRATPEKTAENARGRTKDRKPRKARDRSGGGRERTRTLKPPS